MNYTSRERVRAALNFQESDKIPIDFGGTVCTSVHVDEFVELARYLGIDAEPPKVSIQAEMLARVEGPLAHWFGSDVIGLENPATSWGIPNRDWKFFKTNKGHEVLMPGGFCPVKTDKGYEIRDEKGNVKAEMSFNALYFDNVSAGEFKGEVTFMDPAEFKKTFTLYTDEELRSLERRAKFFHEYTDKAVCGDCRRGSLFYYGIPFAGNTVADWMCALLMEPEYAAEMVGIAADMALENFKLYLEAVGKYIDIVVVSGSDLGTQRGEMFSPNVFEEIYQPNYKRINDYVHQHSHAKIQFHCCGSIYHLIPHFIECGVDILNPVQTGAANMEPQRLKREFGGKIVFWGGGADTQDILPFGTPEQVYEDVKKRIEIFAPGGGFVFSTIHSLQYGVPPENVEAMMNAVRDFGGYGKGKA